jgi:hypothetical protein
MVDLTSHNSFTDWLRSQSSETSITIAARAALRVFPLLIDAFKQPGKDKAISRSRILPVVRLLNIPVAAAKYATAKKLLYYAENAISNSMGGTPSNQDLTIFQSIVTAARAATATTSARLSEDCAEFAIHTLETSEVASNSYYALFQGAIAPYGFSAVDMDIDFIHKGGTPAELITKNLWPAGESIFSQTAWKMLKAVLNDLDENWEVWIDWYDAILKGQPTSGGEHLAIFRVTLNSEEDWKKGPLHVNGLIKAKEAEIATGANFVGSASIKFDAAGAFTTTITEITELEVPSQTSGALVFGSMGDGPIDVIKNDGANRIIVTLDSRDSHSEVQRLTTVLIDLFESGADAPNNGNSLAYQEGLLLRESLGEAIKDVRPGLLIPRGEALRQRLSRNLARDDFTDVAPLSDGMESAVSNLVKAYNGFVGLDSELSKRDEASFGPDAERNLVSPQEGEDLAKSAKDTGVITAEAESAIKEEGKVAPSQPDPANRLSRRFSEGVKNLFRATLNKTIGFVRWIKAHPIRSIFGLGGTGYATAQWVLTHEQWLLNFFANQSTIIEVIRSLVSFLKTLPI